MQIIDPIHDIEKPDPINRPIAKDEPPVLVEVQNINESQNSRFLFLHYLTTLFAAIGSLFSLAFISYGVLDSWFHGEDAVTNSQVLYVTAGLLITVPLFIFAVKKLVGNNDQSQQGVWPVGASHAVLAFSIITLIGAAVSLASWLLFVVFEIISGTSSLAGKDIALTLLGISQAIIWMLLGIKLLLGLRKADQQSSLLLGVFGIAATLVIILAFAFPVRLDRNIKIDARTVNDLTAIQNAISNRGSLPSDLQALKSIKDEGVESRLSQYTYKKISVSEYELCAKFQTDTTDDSGDSSISPLAGIGGVSYSDYSSFYGSSDFNKHKKGQDCFKLSTYSYSAGDGYDVTPDENDSSDSSMYDDSTSSEDQTTNSSSLQSN